MGESSDDDSERDDERDDEDEAGPSFVFTPVSVAGIRKRPGMYIGNPGEDGALQLVFEVVANAYDQYLAGRCTTIDIAIDGDGTVTVIDDGPGIRVTDRSLEQLLTSLSDLPTVDGHRPHMHLGMSGGLGLVVVNALSERFELITAVDDRETRISFARGELIEPATTVVEQHQGTRVRFRPDPQLFAQSRVSRTALASMLEDLAFLSPGLTIRWRIAGDDLARDGLRGRIAAVVPCSVAEVAHGRERHETVKGPLDVEVAIGWRTSGFEAMEAPLVHSFVNFERTREHGVHVDGVLDGVCDFLGTDNRTECVEGLVIAVAVVLADVHYGNPTKDRLATPETRAPVAMTTRNALDTWALAHPAQSAALKARAAQFATVERVAVSLEQALAPHGFVRRERAFERVTEDGLVQRISIDVDTHRERFSRERRYAEFSVRLGVAVPEMAKHREAIGMDLSTQPCLTARLGRLSEPTEEYWPSATADVIPEVLESLERDGLPFFDSLRSRGAIVTACEHTAHERWFFSPPPRVIAAIIVAEQGAIEKATQLLAAQIASTTMVAHHDFVRAIASRLGIAV